MASDQRTRILLIGIDGADLDLIRPWLDAGEMPNLRSIRDRGVHGYLASTIPPVSSPAWASFMTGRNPGRHGCFGFVREMPGTGETVLVSLATIRGTKLWEAFGAAGRKVGIVNVPITYPTPEVDGVFVSGMLTPPGRPFTWPPDFQAEIERVAPDYRIDIDRSLFAEKEEFLRHLHRTMEARATVIEMAMDACDWDLMVGVFTNPDRLQHHFWRDEMDEVRRFYRRIDEHLGTLSERAGEGALVIVLSDHGFTTTDRRFYANRWLKAEGYLAVRRVESARDDYSKRRFNWFMGEPEEAKRKEKLRTRIARCFGLAGDVAIDWSRTRAYLYSSDTRGIHLNLSGRQPQGIVRPSEYEPLRDEIVGKLRALKYPGTDEPVFDLVAKREEIYDGDFVDAAPDIMTVPERDRYRVVTKVDGTKPFRQHRTPGGYHRGPGMLFAAGPGVAAGGTIEGAEIRDVMPTLLYAAGLPIPDGADGRVLRDLFTEKFHAGREERRVAESTAPEAADVTLSKEEDEALRRTLRDLGYL